MCCLEDTITEINIVSVRFLYSVIKTQTWITHSQPLSPPSLFLPSLFPSLPPSLPPFFSLLLPTHLGPVCVLGCDRCNDPLLWPAVGKTVTIPREEP